MTAEETPLVGQGEFTYQPLPGWDQLPDGQADPNAPHDPWVAYVGADTHGKLPAHIEGQLNLLRTAALAKEIGAGVWGEDAIPLTKELILAALERLNDAHSQSLLTTCRTINVKMPQIENSPDNYVRHHTTFFCEDPRLSGSQPGTWIKALALEDKEVPFLSLDQLQDIIDFIAAFVDTDKMIEDTYAKFGKNAATRERRLRGFKLRRRTGASCRWRRTVRPAHQLCDDARPIRAPFPRRYGRYGPGARH